MDVTDDTNQIYKHENAVFESLTLPFQQFSVSPSCCATVITEKKLCTTGGDRDRSYTDKVPGHWSVIQLIYKELETAKSSDLEDF